MVRELERPSAEPVTVTVELPADPDAAERVARGRPGHRGRTCSQGGAPVLLGTREPSGPVVALVADRRVRGAPPGARGGRAGRPPPRHRRAVSVLDAIRRANRPGPPEDSVRLRVACLGAVLVAIGRLRVPRRDRAGRRRSAPWCWSRPAWRSPTPPGPARPGWVKVVVAVGAIAACVWFFHCGELARRSTSRRCVNPLTVLLVSVLVVHSFHVPSRRDLLFSLGASAGLMAVGGRAGHRPPLRPLRGGLGLLRPVVP